MNKFAIFSFLALILSVISFLVLRGPNANLSLGIGILGTLSILGIIFAILSRKWVPAIIGIILNGGVLVFVGFLVLAKGIG